MNDITKAYEKLLNARKKVYKTTDYLWLGYDNGNKVGKIITEFKDESDNNFYITNNNGSGRKN
jgi:hypothetical protein